MQTKQVNLPLVVFPKIHAQAVDDPKDEQGQHEQREACRFSGQADTSPCRLGLLHHLQWLTRCLLVHVDHQEDQNGDGYDTEQDHPNQILGPGGGARRGGGQFVGHRLCVPWLSECIVGR